MLFNKTGVSLEKTNSFNRIVVDYVTDHDDLKKLYEYEDDLSGIESRIKSYTNIRLNRDRLTKAILDQYSMIDLELSGPVAKNIQHLSDENCFTVTTGHQLSILGGPLFVIYKIISVINLAEKITKKFPGYNIVPVFWMATEDHDIEEISSVNVFGKKYIWKNSWKGTAGNMPLDQFEELIEELKHVLGTTANADKLTGLLKDSYLNSKSLGEATRKWMNSLFKDYGLVIIDGNDKALKESITDIFQDEVENKNIFKLISETASFISEKYSVQVNPREINLFYLEKNLRERIVEEGGKYNVLNSEISFSPEEIKNEIKSSPEKFSPNVVMRPIYQESILPDIAYVGGPGEVAYWLELKTSFNHYSVPFPCIFLRSCAIILESSVINKLDQMKIEKENIFLSSDELIRNFITTKSNSTSPVQNTLESMLSEFDKLILAVNEIDSTLKSSVEGEKQRMISSLHNIEEKIIRAEKRKNETEISRIQKIKEKLFPNGNLQEREESMIPYFLKYGDEFIESLIKIIDPTYKKLLLLSETDKK